jgi:predicted porin
MKKSLLALAVLGAFAGAASAQSSVTLFGDIDLSARYVKNGDNAQYQMASSGMNSSKLGFRGVEDLGGGLSAGFWIEGSLNPGYGTATGQTWTRRSTVSLMGNWGEARFGRDYAATFWNTTIFDPFGTNGVGSSTNMYLFLPGTNVASAADPLVRQNNMFAYFLPSGVAGGLYGQVQYAPGMNTNLQKWFAGRIGYAAGPFNVAGAYGETELTPGGNKADIWNIGGSWDFKFMQLMAYYNVIDAKTPGVGNLNQQQGLIGAQGPIGLWQWKATYGWMNRSGGPAAWNDMKSNQFALGGVYNLSKRTALFGTWAGINNKGGATNTVAGLTGNVVQQKPNGDTTGFEVGISHSF